MLRRNLVLIALTSSVLFATSHAFGLVTKKRKGSSPTA